MNTRPLSQKESANLAILNAAGIESIPLFITPTGYRKSICDATDPMRVFLAKNNFHDYSTQGQGQGSKVIRQVQFLSEVGIRFMEMALYRPVTKQGDPRFWVHGSKQFIGEDCVLAFFYDSGSLCIVNLSSANMASPAITSYLNRHAEQANRISRELLAKLRHLADTPLPATCDGDTAIGRAIETALGVKMNPRKTPDYKGIELKSKRRLSTTRNTLFACVPDWTLSTVKGFRTFLDRFGYQKDDDFKLYCTVSTQKPNSQGLVLSLQEADRFLWESARKNEADERLLAWPMALLEESLVTKHKETFWIKADSMRDKSGSEMFLLKTITHTRNPNVPQFSRLLADGSITVDHLIKRKPSGMAHEKGPLFKLAKGKLPELFMGAPAEYDLTT